jgi:predicted secreted protein
MLALMIPIPPDAIERVLSEPQNGAMLDVLPGESLQVRLSARPPSGYRWTVSAGPPGVLITQQAYSDIGLHIGTGRPGVGPGEEVFEVRVVALPGRTAPLAFTYSRPGARVGLARVWKVRLHVVPGPAAPQPRRPR